MELIVFDESEYLASPVNDETLLAVLALYGQEEKDKLLIKKEDAQCTISPLDYSKVL